MNPKRSPGLGYKRVMSCKDSFHAQWRVPWKESQDPLVSGLAFATPAQMLPPVTLLRLVILDIAKVPTMLYHACHLAKRAYGFVNFLAPMWRCVTRPVTK